MPLRIAIVVGESSGDQLAAKLMPALSDHFAPDRIEWIGVGGERMASLGFQSLFPLSDIAVMGIFPVLARLPLILRRIAETADAVIRSRPDVLVIIDSPDFTHRVARRVRSVLPELPVVDYVSPTVWAWRPGRARRMRAYVDHVLALLPFEPAIHRRLGGPECTYVGHPLTERLSELRPSEAETAERASRPERLLVLPGSRRSEIRRLMPVFGETVRRLSEHVSGSLEVILPAVSHLREEITTLSTDWEVKPELVFGERAKLEAFRTARVALAASGTVTLELALAAIPMVVAYKVSFLEGQLRHVIRVPSIVLPNLVLGKNLIPEHIQAECNPEQLTRDLLPLFFDAAAREAQLDGFQRLESLMTTGIRSPSQISAAIIARLIKRQ